MRSIKTTVLSAIAVAMLGTAGFANDVPCLDDTCPPQEPPSDEPEFGNPGNAKPVGNSRWDGITGNSGNNNPGPGAAPMEDQRDDLGAQPGGKGVGPSTANK